MRKNWILALLALPGNVVVVIPAVILLGTRHVFAAPPPWVVLAAAAFLFAGALLASRTMRLFNDLGEGTAAPWRPPRRLVTSGPYRHVRNPMITAVLSMLTGEAILFRSPALAAYTILFFLLNCLYFSMVEEKELEKRFGREYIEYKKATPRWLPRGKSAPGRRERPPRDGG